MILQSLTLIQNQTQTEAIAQAYAQAQAQKVLDELSLKLTALSIPPTVVASSSLISPLVTSSTLAPPFVAPSVLTSPVINTPVVHTLISPTTVSSPIMVTSSVPSSITTPLITTTYPQLWSNSTKLQSQTTFSGKENENVEDWLNLLDVYFKVGIIPTDKWVLVAATYLRESALKLYTGKRQFLKGNF